MGHYEERLERDLTRIRKQVRLIGDLVQHALANSTRTVLTIDRDLANETILGDLKVNRETRELDRLCHGFVARHLPSAGHLRFVSSVMRLNIALERIGDYAETISRTAVQLTGEPPEAVSEDIQMMAVQSRRLFQLAMQGFNDLDADVAKQTIASARQLAPSFDKVFADLVAEGDQGTRPTRDLFGYLATCNRLERVIHQAKNICEETVFAATGETKQLKTFDILFLDERNDGAALLAEHIAKKAFPDGGMYRSAGWNAADAVEPAYVEFAEQHGMDLSEATPRSLALMPELLSEYEIVVALDTTSRKQLGSIPFHTVLLEWPITATGPEAAYKELAPQIRELMEKLRGEDA